MMGLACCVACGAYEPADDLVTHIVETETQPGELVSDAVVERCVKRLNSHVNEAREMNFAPHRQDAVLSQSHAEHEAAHAVVGVLLGATVRSVNIDTSVKCVFAALDHLPPTDRAVIALAGPAIRQADQNIRTRSPANVRFCLRAAEALVRKPCDACQAMRNVVVLSEADPIEAFHALEDQAISLVRRPHVRAAIERVAAALMECGHLSGAEVEAVADLNRSEAMR